MQNPIHKALSSTRKCGAKTLVMGGQACVFYGAAEFSRDLDLAITTEPGNLFQLQADYPKIGEAMIPTRPCLRLLRSRDEPGLQKALLEEELEEREKDKRYWAPLKATLAVLKSKRQHGLS